MMKDNSQKMQELMGQVIPEDVPSCGPDRAALMAMISRERGRRRHRRMVASLAGAVVLAGLFLIRNPGAPPHAPVTEPPPPAQHAVIQELNDQQFLALLKDTPVALMEWPNGERTLLVVER